MEICGACGIQKHGDVFRTFRDRSYGSSSSPDFVRTRICQYAKAETRNECINTGGAIDNSLAYNNFGITTEQWLETARQLIAKHRHNDQPVSACLPQE